MMSFTSCLAALALLAAPSGAGSAEHDFAAMIQPVPASAKFSDQMVLQREAKVPVWGTATTGESVSVRQTMPTLPKEFQERRDSQSQDEWNRGQFAAAGESGLCSCQSSSR